MKRCGLAVVLVFFAGCVRFHPAPISPQKVAAQWEERSLTNEGLQIFLERNLSSRLAEWPVKSWDFNSLQLAAFYYQPSLEVARADWSAAQAGIKTAAGRLNPTVAVTAGYDTGVASDPTPWMPAISFDVPLETAGKRKKRMALAARLSEVSRWNIVTLIWRTRSAVRTALLDFYAAREAGALALEAQAAQANVVKLLEGRREAGAVSEFEVSQARLALDRSLLVRQQTHSQEIVAIAALAEAIGLPASALQDVHFSFGGVETVPKMPTERAVRRQALLHRPDVLAALADYAASEDSLRLEIAKQYPDIHLNPGYMYNQGNEGDNEWQLGLSVELPILNRNQGPIAEAEGRRVAAAARFRSIQARAAAEIDLALAGYQSALKESQVVETFWGNLQKRLQAVVAQEKAGEVDALDMADARVEFYAGAQSRLETRVKVLQLFGRLEDAIQSPLTLSDATVQNVVSSTSPPNPP